MVTQLAVLREYLERNRDGDFVLWQAGTTDKWVGCFKTQNHLIIS